ncbi:MAG: ribonuclease HII, partial [Candidatus Nealsonbacteria bacterium CG18_big_fil_WC_8_21_14_2_50_37_10]
DKHKGCGTKLHQAILMEYGPSKIHRKSFKPVKNMLQLKYEE